jgi:RNA polymerase sigma-70 factor (ECF subfamily)
VLGPLDTVERRDSVSLALLVLLERLSPVERAVFVLREAFGYSHREVAEAVEVSEANSRQLYRRARQRIADVAGGSGKTPGTVGLTGADTDADPARRQELVERFLAAAEEGELPALERMLAEDVTVWVDGGGRVSAALRPVTGAARVARYLIGAAGAAGRSVRLSAVEVNGVPGAFASVGGDLVGVLVPEPVGERIGGLRIVTNPEKLGFAARLSPPGARLSHSAGLSGS